MKFLIAEDDPVSRTIMTAFLSPHAQCDVAVDGQETIEAYQRAVSQNAPYDLILLDIMMPKIDGQEALIRIREWERSRKIADAKRVKVIMTTALGNPKNVIDAFYKGGAMSYLVKPIEKQKLLVEIRKLGLAV